MEKAGKLEEMENDQSPSFKAPAKSRRKGSVGDVARRQTSGGAMLKNWSVRFIGDKEVISNEPM